MQSWDLQPHPSKKRGRIGVFACGHNLYWPQFPALKEKLTGHYTRFLEDLRSRLDADIISVSGMCDTPEAACAAGRELAGKDVDAVFCYIATYTPSANVLPVAQITRCPMILLSLQPSAAMDYTVATTELQLENDCITSLPEIAGVLKRAGLPAADIIVGTLDNDDRARQRTEAWAGLSSALRALRTSRIGLLGHVYEGMLDMNSDPTVFDAVFGMHTVHLETGELKARIHGASTAEIKARKAEIGRLFHFPEQGSDPVAGP
ncbi:MAG: arabinose isomerase, partial [bacterium]|nr:arabinose isomerase [bacterium]